MRARVPPAAPTPQAPRRTFGVLLLAYTLSQFYRAFLAIVAADLSRDLGLGAAQLGAISGAWFAAFALAQLPVGWALDRFGPRRTMAGFMVAAVTGALWLARARGYAGALGAMALIGVGCSPVLMGSMYLFARVHPPERFAMLSSLILGLGSAGNLLGATPLALAVEAAGWRPTMGAIAALTALSALLVLLLVVDPPRVAGAAPAEGMLRGLGRVLTIRPLWRLLPLALVSYAVVIATRSLWMAPFLGEVHGFDVTARGHAALAMAAAMSLGALVYGPLERALGDPKRTVLVGSVVTGGLYLVLGLGGHRGAGLAVALLSGIGATGFTYAILMAHARRFLPAEVLGRGVTSLNFAFIGGAGVLQWLSGSFVEAQQAAGAAPAATFGRLHLAFGGVLLAATAVYLFAPAQPRAARPGATPAA